MLWSPTCPTTSCGTSSFPGGPRKTCRRKKVEYSWSDIMSARPALQTADLLLRDATVTDHDALQSLDGAAPDAGAALIQARRNFFARTAGYIFNVRVNPGQRTRGVGSMMMRAAADWLESQGAPYVTGLIGVTNVASIK